MRNDRKNGFTLIELLVVISIIGVLSSIVLQSLNSARAKADDTRRISDIKAIATAINMYFNDNGFYPPSATTCPAGDWDANFKTALIPNYISSLPLDPKNNISVCSGSQYNYYYYFSNSLTSALGTKCAIQDIVLSSVGASDSKVFQDACGLGTGSGINTIIFKQ